MKNLFGEDYSDIPKKQVTVDSVKRNWENAFQKWSNKMATDDNNYESYGQCGFGVMCDYCKDNLYGRPCVRALNEWLRAKRKSIDYSEKDFKKIWDGDI